MDMVERVARAIADKDGFEPYADTYIRKARAAIEAMREPTEDMVDAMNDVAIDGPDYVSFYPSFSDCRDLYRAAINGALIAHVNTAYQTASTVNETQGKAGTNRE